MKEEAARGVKASEAAEVVEAALDAVAGLLPPGVELEREGDATLAAPEGPLDSLGIVNLVAAVEEEASRRGFESLELFQALALPLEESPFRSVATLERWVGEALAEER